ncbi:hypothetical protein [Paraburkholderia terricola]|uniref:hypothetical protein n=1 Tax=Paraburkholderia terricola TaxID=169427 RepID=UPI00286D66B8|nr:hypothetical protein [Paraburkholderia terricola]
MKNEVMADKTAIRITVDLDDDDPLLHSFVEWSKENERPGYAKTIGLSALYDLRSLSDAELKRAYKKAQTKEGTWWLYFGEVAPSSITRVAAISGSAFVPYSFESHGRKTFRQYGFSAVGPESLASLAPLLPSAHAFDVAKAFCICADAGARSTVVVRGGGYQFELDLQTGRLLKGDAPENLAAIVEWIRRHESELAACWTDSVEVFHHYYPDQRRMENQLADADALNGRM